MYLDHVDFEDMESNTGVPRGIQSELDRIALSQGSVPALVYVAVRRIVAMLDDAKNAPEILELQFQSAYDRLDGVLNTSTLEDTEECEYTE